MHAAHAVHAVSGVALFASALQQCNVLLTTDCAGIVAVDHIHTGACIACQCQQVNTLSVQQSECDSTVPQAVQRSALSVGSSL